MRTLLIHIRTILPRKNTRIRGRACLFLCFVTTDPPDSIECTLVPPFMGSHTLKVGHTTETVNLHPSSVATNPLALPHSGHPLFAHRIPIISFVKSECTFNPTAPARNGALFELLHNGVKTKHSFLAWVLLRLVVPTKAICKKKKRERSACLCTPITCYFLAVATERGYQNAPHRSKRPACLLPISSR